MLKFALKEAIARYERETGQSLTYRDLHAKSGVALGSIVSMATNQQRRVDLDVLWRLCQFFGISAGDLIVESPDDSPESDSSD